MKEEYPAQQLYRGNMFQMIYYRIERARCNLCVINLTKKLMIYYRIESSELLDVIGQVLDDDDLL